MVRDLSVCLRVATLAVIAFLIGYNTEGKSGVLCRHYRSYVNGYR